VYDRKRDVYNYYDSYGTFNLDAAKLCVGKLAPFINPKCKNQTEVDLDLRKTPQQPNDYDCGVYTLGITDYLAKTGGDDSQIANHINPKSITSLREEIFNLIKSQYEKDTKQKI